MDTQKVVGKLRKLSDAFSGGNDAFILRELIPAIMQNASEANMQNVINLLEQRWNMQQPQIRSQCLYISVCLMMVDWPAADAFFAKHFKE